MPKASKSNHPDPATVERRAYQIWENEGRPDGKHLDHWDQATPDLMPKPKRAARAASKTKATTWPAIHKNLPDLVSTNPARSQTSG